MLNKSQKAEENVKNIEKSVAPIEKVLDQNDDWKIVAIEDIEEKLKILTEKLLALKILKKIFKNVDKNCCS